VNLLAHAYLSFGQPEILVGNMISDFVKGKKKFDYPPGVQTGIMLHRAIDTFTDFHPATKEAKVFLKPAAGPYAGAFVDVVYDHFLANDAAQFADVSLQQTALNIYATLSAYEAIFPSPFRQMLPYMISQNWLYNYHSMLGMQNSFGGVVRRAAYLTGSDAIFTLFKQHYSSLEKCYKDFFPDVKAYAYDHLQSLLSK
jgi:acyl carrier protein phosphodiesterase